MCKLNRKANKNVESIFMFKFHEKIVQKRLIIVDRKINLSTFSETKDADKKRRNHAGTEGFLAQHPAFRNIII